MALSVKLNVFEGPLDLLLHLIDKNKIDIYDIPIVEITDQYMEYLHSMEKEDLGIMSEFLVMAATLLDIKCKMLLPKEVNEEGEEEDPRAELVQKLLEYKMYKYMSYELRDRLGDAAGVYHAERRIPAGAFRKGDGKERENLRAFALHGAVRAHYEGGKRLRGQDFAFGAGGGDGVFHADHFAADDGQNHAVERFGAADFKRRAGCCGQAGVPGR